MIVQRERASREQRLSKVLERANNPDQAVRSSEPKVEIEQDFRASQNTE